MFPALFSEELSTKENSLESLSRMEKEKTDGHKALDDQTGGSKSGVCSGEGEMVEPGI